VLRGFESTDGERLGGQGAFGVTWPLACNLICCDSGLVTLLDLWLSVWEGQYMVGLFKNDFEPKLTMSLGDLAICDFSGYSGEQPAYSWQAAVMQGIRAATQAGPLTWIHDGGPIQNYVYGYYVVDASAALIWAERFCPAPMRVYLLGQRVRVRPTMYLVNDVLV